MEQVLLRLGDVQRRVGLRRSTIYDLVRRGDFPPPVRLGRRCSAWVSAEIDQWIAAWVAKSRGRGSAQFGGANPLPGSTRTQGQASRRTVDSKHLSYPGRQK
jgi:prophage regulatory protein